MIIEVDIEEIFGHINDIVRALYNFILQADLNGDEMVSFEEFHDIFFEGQ